MYYKECHLNWVPPGEGREHDYSNKGLIRLKPIAIFKCYISTHYLLENWRSFEGYIDILFLNIYI